MDTLKVSQGPPGDHGPFFENCWYRDILKAEMTGNKQTKKTRVKRWSQIT